MPPYTTYLKYFFAVATFLLAAVAAFNYAADPAGIYHSGKSWDWIQSRPEILDTMYLYKAHGVEDAQADILFIGSSRVNEGFDPTGPALPERAYNLGLVGAHVYEPWRYLQHASAFHLPKTVLIGVDSSMFAADAGICPLFTEDRLSVRSDGHPTPFYQWADVLPTLLSTNYLEWSWNTLFPRARSIQYRQGYQADAPAALHDLNLAHQVLAANKTWVDEIDHSHFRDAKGQQPQMDAFEHIVSFCAEHHIRLIVVAMPLHSLLLDKLTDNDWTYYESWMKTLAESLEKQPALQSEFWDFTGYNSMSTEPLPKPTDQYSHMRFYWEGSHFRKNVGDMVLARIFQDKGPPSFGRRVTLATVDQDVARLKAEKAAWHEHGAVSPP